MRFRFPRFLGYEAAKLHGQRDSGRPRNPKRLKRERHGSLRTNLDYDAPRDRGYERKPGTGPLKF